MLQIKGFHQAIQLGVMTHGLVNDAFMVEVEQLDGGFVNYDREHVTNLIGCTILLLLRLPSVCRLVTVNRIRIVAALFPHHD
jgi:hypothetical protein